MDWFLSAVVLFGNFLVGQKRSKWGWVVLTANSIFWIYYALNLNPPQYGLIPSSVAMLFLTLANARKWFADKEKSAL
jgi:hypothetical protein